MAITIRSKVITGYSGTLIINEKRLFHTQYIDITSNDTTNKKFVITIKDDGVNVSETIESNWFYQGQRFTDLLGRPFSPQAQIEIKVYQEPRPGQELDTITVSLTLEYVNSVLEDSYDEEKRAIRVVMNGAAEDLSYVDDTNDGSGNTVWVDPSPETIQQAITRLANALYHYSNNKI